MPDEDAGAGRGVARRRSAGAALLAVLLAVLLGLAGAVSAAPAAALTLTLSVTCTGACVAASGYYVGFGSFLVTGTAGGMPAGSVVYVLRDGARVGSAVVGADQRYRWTAPVTRAGATGFRVSTSSVAGTPASVTSSTAALTVQASGVALSTPTAFSSYALGPATIAGRIAPGLSGRTLTVAVLVAGTWVVRAAPVTGPGGSFTVTEAWDLGSLGAQQWRVSLPLPDGGQADSPVVTITKVAELRVTTRGAASSDVPKTYRSGCPVTPAMLTRVDLNFYGFDGRLHRGFLVVRSTHASRFVAAFTQAFATRFPLRVMQDPSPYGNDYVSMENDNTYAFYCRQVTGNPYALSPHSYGGSVDINTVENPYRQPNGTWVPPNGASYVNRDNPRPGMLYPSTPLVKTLLAQGFEWLYGFDYQHFQL